MHLLLYHNFFSELTTLLTLSDKYYLIILVSQSNARFGDVTVSNAMDFRCLFPYDCQVSVHQSLVNTCCLFGITYCISSLNPSYERGKCPSKWVTVILTCFVTLLAPYEILSGRVNEPANEIMVTSEGWGEPAHAAQSRQSLRFVHAWRTEGSTKIRHLTPIDGYACAFEEGVYGGRNEP